MNTCKDCIHCDVCSVIGNVTALNVDFDENGMHCLYFKDKSHIIELPFNIGDTIYYFSCEPSKKICLKDKNPYILHDEIISLEFQKNLDDNVLLVKTSRCVFYKGFKEFWFVDKSEAKQKLNQILNLQNRL